MARKRILAQGRPGTAKTGALASLINTGRYKVGIEDFEGNLSPLTEYVDPKFYGNVNVVKLRDKLVVTDSGVITVRGTPTAFRNAWRAIDEFVGVDLNGKEADWGPATEWDESYILVTDSITQMGNAAMRRILAMNNRSIMNRRIQEWGVVQEEISGFYYALEANTNCHIYAPAHLKMIGPKLIEADDSGVSEELAGELNERTVQVVPTRLYPVIPGQNLAQSFVGQFDYALLFEVEELSGGRTRRVIRTTPTPAVDVKVPSSVSLPETLPIETGLLTIFEGTVPTIEGNEDASQGKRKRR